MFHGIFAHPRESSVCKHGVCRFWVPCPVPAPPAALPNQGNVHLLCPLPDVMPISLRPRHGADARGGLL